MVSLNPKNKTVYVTNESLSSKYKAGAAKKKWEIHNYLKHG